MEYVQAAGIKFLEVDNMKKAFVFIFFAMVVSGVCFAQDTNNEQRITGTWMLNTDRRPIPETWTFNANGTLSVSLNPGNVTYKYGITDQALVMIVTEALPTKLIKVGASKTYHYSVSSDGETLILEYVSAGASESIWLVRQ